MKETSTKDKALGALSLTPWIMPLSLLLYGFLLLPTSAILLSIAGAFWGLLIIKAAFS